MRRRVRVGRLSPRARLVAGMVLISGITFAQSAYGLATAGGRVDPEVREALASGEFVDVLVELGYPPEVFHLKQLQVHGTVTATSDTGLALLRVGAEEIDVLARTAWISRVHLLEEGQ